jgi:hypothetical protein
MLCDLLLSTLLNVGSDILPNIAAGSRISRQVCKVLR